MQWVLNIYTLFKDLKKMMLEVRYLIRYIYNNPPLVSGFISKNFKQEGAVALDNTVLQM